MLNSHDQSTTAVPLSGAERTTDPKALIVQKLQERERLIRENIELRVEVRGLRQALADSPQDRQASAPVAATPETDGERYWRRIAIWLSVLIVALVVGVCEWVRRS